MFASTQKRKQCRPQTPLGKAKVGGEEPKQVRQGDLNES